MSAPLRLRLLRRLPALVGAVLLLAPRADAQCGTQGNRAFDSFTVTPVSLIIPQIGVTEFDRGSSATVPYTVTVDPRNNNRNRNWYLCLRATTATFPAVAGYTKPIGDLQWSLDGSTWTNVTTGAQPVTSDRGTTTFALYVRLLVDYADDPPGTYGPAPLTFTVSH